MSTMMRTLAMLGLLLLTPACNDFPELEAPLDPAGPTVGEAPPEAPAGGPATGGSGLEAVTSGAPSPWSFADADSDEPAKTPEEEAAKRAQNPGAVAFSETYGDPTTVVDEEIQRLATIALLGWDQREENLDSVLALLGMSREQAVEGFRGLADDTLRSLAFQHTLRHYQQLHLSGEFTPEVPLVGQPDEPAAEEAVDREAIKAAEAAEATGSAEDVE